MKSASAGMISHLGQEVTSLATCWVISRTDGQEFFFTTHDVDLRIDGDDYRASVGFSRTAVANNAALGVDNLDIEGIFDDASITDEDLRAGLYDYASVFIFVVNWADLSQGIIRMRRGWLGEVVTTKQGTFRAELRGMTQALQQKIGERYQAECRADLGDHRCRIPIDPPLRADSTAYAVGQFVKVVTDGAATGYAQYENRIYKCVTAGTSDATAPTFDTLVGNLTTDGTAVWEAVEAWTRHGVVATVTSRRNFTLTVTEPRGTNGWFNGGVLTFESGDNAGRSMEIKSWTQTGGVIELWLPVGYLPEVGDLVRLYRGCDKTMAVCSTVFDNAVNKRSEDYVPGRDAAMEYPNAPA